jgi:hypothetical protein
MTLGLEELPEREPSRGVTDDTAVERPQPVLAAIKEPQRFALIPALWRWLVRKVVPR